MAELNNVNPSKDAWMSGQAGTQDDNHGADTTLKAGADGNFGIKQRPIMQFDISAIPSGSTIDSATLGLSVSTAAAAGDTYRFDRCTSTGWVEAEVSWNESESGLSWTSSGGDLDTGVRDNLTAPTGTGLHSFSVINNAQDAVDNRSGLMSSILYKTDENDLTANHWEFDSSEGTTPPDLDITYTEAASTGRTYDGVLRGVMRGAGRGVMGLLVGIGFMKRRSPRRYRLRISGSEVIHHALPA